MDSISLEQRFTLLTKLGENLGWDSLTQDQVQVGIREAHTFAAREFEAFIRNGFRVHVGDFFRETGELTIQIPALARPTLEQLREKYSWIREENGIKHDTSPTEAVTLKLGTVLHTDEERVNGTEYEQRIVPKLSICLSYQQALWLVEHQNEFPALMPLLGKAYIDFPGLVVVSASGARSFPYLVGDGRRWNLGWRWFNDGLNRYGRVAVSCK